MLIAILPVVFLHMRLGYNLCSKQSGMSVFMCGVVMWEAYAVMLQLVWQKNVLMAILPVVMFAHPPAQCACFSAGETGLQSVQQTEWNECGNVERICYDAPVGLAEECVDGNIACRDVAHPPAQCACFSADETGLQSVQQTVWNECVEECVYVLGSCQLFIAAALLSGNVESLCCDTPVGLAEE